MQAAILAARPSASTPTSPAISMRWPIFQSTLRDAVPAAGVEGCGESHREGDLVASSRGASCPTGVRAVGARIASARRGRRPRHRVIGADGAWLRRRTRAKALAARSRIHALDAAVAVFRFRLSAGHSSLLLAAVDADTDIVGVTCDLAPVRTDS